MRKTKVLAVVITLLLLGAFGAARGAIYIQSTIAQYQYAAPCFPLHGVPRLLQMAHFVPSGGCIVDVKKGGCHDSRACTITNPPSGGSDKGNCSPSPDGQDCYCVARK